MSSYSSTNIQHVSALKTYAAEVMRQHADLEIVLQKEQKVLLEVEEMQTIYSDNEEVLALFNSQMTKCDGLLLELDALEQELADVKGQILRALNPTVQDQATPAMQVIEAHMNAIGKEVPRVSPIAKKMQEADRRRRLDALKQAAREKKTETESIIERAASLKVDANSESRSDAKDDSDSTPSPQRKLL